MTRVISSPSRSTMGLTTLILFILPSLVFRTIFWYLRDQHTVDAAAVHIDDLEAQILPIEALADFRQMAEFPEDEARQRVIVVVRFEVAPVEIPFQLIDVDGSVDQPRAVFAANRGRFRFSFGLLEFAGDGREDIRRGDNTFETAVFIDDQRYVQGGAAEQFEQLQHRRAFVNEQRLAGARREIEGLAGQRAVEQVLGVDDALDGVDLAASDRKARPHAFDDRFPDLFLAVRPVEPNDIDARRHDGANRPIGEPHHPIDHVAFGGLEDARRGTFGDESPHLL